MFTRYYDDNGDGSSKSGNQSRCVGQIVVINTISIIIRRGYRHGRSILYQERGLLLRNVPHRKRTFVSSSIIRYLSAKSCDVLTNRSRDENAAATIRRTIAPWPKLIHISVYLCPTTGECSLSPYKSRTASDIAYVILTKRL